jgi:hypothetical protein
MPLPSASISVMSHDITGFKYRELSPHKFTPMLGVHKVFKVNRSNCSAGREPYLSSTRDVLPMALQGTKIKGIEHMLSASI